MRKVLLRINLSEKAGQDRAGGVFAYVREHGPWDIQIQTELSDPMTAAKFGYWQPDGIITAASFLLRYPADAVHRNLRGRIPMVVFSPMEFARNRFRNASIVSQDDRGIGVLAAKHLLTKGLRNFAYYAQGSNTNYGRTRERAFRATLGKRVESYSTFGSEISKSDPLLMGQDRLKLANWLRGLPKPCGLFACRDIDARLVLSVAQECGIAVPDELALVGVDNDVSCCESSSPELTSVDPDFRAGGYLSARILDGLMAGGSVIRTVHRPLGVVERRSSAYVAQSDSFAARVAEAIRVEACGDFDVGRLAGRLHISRRAMEMRFRQAFGTSIYAAVQDRRLEMGRHLLETSDLPLSEIAGRCGYSSDNHFKNLFKRRLGVTMGEWRRGVRCERAVAQTHSL